MKKICALFLCLALAGLAAGCQSNKTRVAEGGVIGGVLGAAAGGIIGHQMGRGAEGAGIGAAVGAATGALVGSQIEKPGAAGTQAATNPNQLSMQQVIDLTKQGVNEAVIIDRIRLSNSQFALTADDITYLKQQGVSVKVIDAMQGK